MHQPKDYLIAVNLACRTEFVDGTIADSRSNLNKCKENPVYTLPRDKLRQDLTDEIKFFKGWCSPNLQIVIGILKLQRSLSPSLCRVHISGPHLLQMWRSRPQSAYLSKSVAWFPILPNLNEKRPIETHPYELLKIMSTHHLPLILTNVHRFFWKRRFLYIVKANCKSLLRRSNTWKWKSILYLWKS